MSDRLYTSQQADEYINDLQLETKLDKCIIARIAFVYSLTNNGTSVPSIKNITGGEIRQSSFMGVEGYFIKALIYFFYQKNDFTDDELYSNKSIIKNHIEDGIRLLWDLYNKNNQNISLWYKDLLKDVNLKNIPLLTNDLDLNIGKGIINNENVIIELNNTKTHANSHLAIMGKPGAGKTQFLLKLLADIRKQSNFQTNFIFFDYKGDVVNDKDFINITKSSQYKLLQNNVSLPINPFVLNSYDEQSILLSAREKAENFSSISSKLGVVQKGILTDIIVKAYKSRKGEDMPFPDFNDILILAQESYEENFKNDDSLIEILRDLSKFNLFWSHVSDAKPFDKISDKSMVIDIHTMPVLKELVTYLVIERLYKEMVSLPDSNIKDNRREIRTILVIDEAHNYLCQNNLFLQKIIREGRSKGVVVFFASQSPSDYQQKHFNFQELLEFAFIFKCEGVSPSSIQDILGCNQKTAKDLQIEIARLDPFQAICRSNNKSEEFIKFTATSFFKSYFKNNY